jgi:hypothetical protein
LEIEMDAGIPGPERVERRGKIFGETNVYGIWGSALRLDDADDRR